MSEITGEEIEKLARQVDSAWNDDWTERRLLIMAGMRAQIEALEERVADLGRQIRELLAGGY